MASVTQSLVSFLLGKSAITSIVSDRIKPDKIDQNMARPAICFWTYGTDDVQTVAGRVGSAKTQVTVECWAETRTSCQELAKTVKETLMPTDESFPIRGDLSGVTFYDVSVVSGARDYFVSLGDGTEESIYISSQDFSFTHAD